MISYIKILLTYDIPLTSSANTVVVVNVVRTGDQAPTFTADAYTIYVSEGIPNDTSIFELGVSKTICDINKNSILLFPSLTINIIVALIDDVIKSIVFYPLSVFPLKGYWISKV